MRHQVAYAVCSQPRLIPNSFSFLRSRGQSRKWHNLPADAAQYGAGLEKFHTLTFLRAVTPQNNSNKSSISRGLSWAEPLAFSLPLFGGRVEVPNALHKGLFASGVDRTKAHDCTEAHRNNLKDISPSYSGPLPRISRIHFQVSSHRGQPARASNRPRNRLDVGGDGPRFDRRNQKRLRQRS